MHSSGTEQGVHSFAWLLFHHHGVVGLIIVRLITTAYSLQYSTSKTACKTSHNKKGVPDECKENLDAGW